MKHDFLIVDFGHFGGRLAEFKYYDIASIIEKVLVLW